MISQATADTALANYLDAPETHVFATNANANASLRRACAAHIPGVTTQVYDIALARYYKSHPQVQAVPHWAPPTTLAERLVADGTGNLQAVIAGDQDGKLVAAMMGDDSGNVQAVLLATFGTPAYAPIRGAIINSTPVSAAMFIDMLVNDPNGNDTIGQVMYGVGVDPNSMPADAQIEEMRVVTGFLPVLDGTKVYGGKVVPI